MPFEELPRDSSLADPLPSSPLGLIERWLDEATHQNVSRNPTAMAIATADPHGSPSARMVICRGYDARLGFVVFYTDRRSRKGRELAVRPQGAAVFHWDPLQRQIRLEGPVVQSPEEESDRYFRARTRLSQIAAWASHQSRRLESRNALLGYLAAQEKRFEKFSTIPRPPFWGGYRLIIENVELWVGSEGRAHDRALWTRNLTKVHGDYVGGSWSVTRLQP